MSKRANGEEAIGPVVDGSDFWQPVEQPQQAEQQEFADAEPEEETPEPEEYTVLICGAGERADALARLASDCGFVVRRVALSPDQISADGISVLAEENFAGECAVGRNHFICLFLEPDLAERILFQCLASDARYLGVWADSRTRSEIFQRLREDGAPDAELAAVCCPMGMAVGAETPEQDAVAVVAEMLAAKAGVLKRFRQA